MNRITEIQNYLSENKLDAFLVLTKINRQYLSGFTGSAGYLLITKHDARLFVDGRYFLRAKKETKLPVREMKQHSDILKNVRVSKVAIEDRISLKEFSNLKQQLKKVSWKITSNLIENLRAQKRTDEIAAIKKGSQIIDQAFERVKRLIKRKRGVTEAEVAYQIERFGKNHGVEGVAFEPIVAFGPNAAIPHHSSSKQKIGRNSFLLLDFGFRIKDYHSDFTRTLFIGKPSSFAEKVYNIVLEAQKKAIESIRIGQKAFRVDQQARLHITKNKFGKYFTHNTGHGVGLEIHELPNLSADSQTTLAKNMIVTVEPGIYLPGKFGVRIEDMMVVTDKPRILSEIPKDLKSMIIK